MQPWTAFLPIWRTWWLGDATGAVIVAPAIIAFSARPRDLTWKDGAEIAALVAGLSAASVVVFTHSLDGAAHYPVEYLVFPFLIWAAIRFGIAGAAFANVLTSASASGAPSAHSRRTSAAKATSG